MSHHRKEPEITMRAIITDIAKLNKAIDSIASRGKKLDHDIQVAGLSAIAHVEKCGDIGPVNRLYHALGKGARKSALTAWLLAYSKVEANVGEDKKDKPFVYAKGKVTNLEEADANPWFDFKPDADPTQVFDLQAAVAALIKRAEGKALAEGGADILEKLRAIA
jgi:hypothetical protein